MATLCIIAQAFYLIKLKYELYDFLLLVETVPFHGESLLVVTSTL